MHKRIILFLFLFLVLFSFVNAKSYFIEKADIAMYVDENARVYVDELLTFNFSGEYTFAYRDLPDSLTAHNYYVLDENENPLNFEITKEGAYNRLTWHYNAKDEKRTFIVGYILDDLINVYDDYSEFNYHVWGENWPYLKELYVQFALPKEVDPKEIYSYGHPNVDGKIGMIENRKIILQAFNIPENQFVELRVLFPTPILDSKEFGKIINENGLERIIAEENKLSMYSNFINNIFFVFAPLIFLIVFLTFIIKKLKNRKLKNILSLLAYLLGGILLLIVFFIFWFYSNVGFYWYIIFFLLQVILFLVLWYIYGREPEVNLESVYEKEVPYDYSPAVVSALFNLASKTPDNDSLLGEFLNLAFKKKIKINYSIKKTDEEYSFKIISKDTKDLEESEALLLNLLIDACSFKIDGVFFKKKLKVDMREISFKELNKYLLFVEKGQTLGYTFISKWQDCVKKQAKELGFFDKSKWVLPYVLGSFIFALIGFFISYFISLLIVILAFCLLLLFSDALPRRTIKGATHYSKWIKLRDYLEQFSDMKNKTPKSLELWEKYLIYSVPLGVADKVMKSMYLSLKEKETSQDRAFSNFWFYSSSIDAFTNFNSTFNSNFTNAVSASGSSGFSGGSSGGASSGGGGAG